MGNLEFLCAFGILILWPRNIMQFRFLVVELVKGRNECSLFVLVQIKIILYAHIGLDLDYLLRS